MAETVNFYVFYHQKYFINRNKKGYQNIIKEVHNYIVQKKNEISNPKKITDRKSIQSIVNIVNSSPKDLSSEQTKEVITNYLKSFEDNNDDLIEIQTALQQCFERIGPHGQVDFKGEHLSKNIKKAASGNKNFTAQEATRLLQNIHEYINVLYLLQQDLPYYYSGSSWEQLNTFAYKLNQIIMNYEEVEGQVTKNIFTKQNGTLSFKPKTGKELNKQLQNLTKEIVTFVSDYRIRDYWRQIQGDLGESEFANFFNNAADNTVNEAITATIIGGKDKSISIDYKNIEIKVGLYNWRTANISGSLSMPTQNKVDVKLTFDAQDFISPKIIGVSVKTSRNLDEDIKILSGNLMNLFAFNFKFLNVFANYYSIPDNAQDVYDKEDEINKVINFTKKVMAAQSLIENFAKLKQNPELSMAGLLAIKDVSNGQWYLYSTREILDAIFMLDNPYGGERADTFFTFNPDFNLQNRFQHSWIKKSSNSKTSNKTLGITRSEILLNKYMNCKVNIYLKSVKKLHNLLIKK